MGIFKITILLEMSLSSTLFVLSRMIVCTDNKKFPLIDGRLRK